MRHRDCAVHDAGVAIALGNACSNDLVVHRDGIVGLNRRMPPDIVDSKSTDDGTLTSDLVNGKPNSERTRHFLEKHARHVSAVVWRGFVPLNPVG